MPPRAEMDGLFLNVPRVVCPERPGPTPAAKNPSPVFLSQLFKQFNRCFSLSGLRNCSTSSPC